MVPLLATGVVLLAEGAVTLVDEGVSVGVGSETSVGKVVSDSMMVLGS